MRTRTRVAVPQLGQVARTTPRFPGRDLQRARIGPQRPGIVTCPLASTTTIRAAALESGTSEMKGVSAHGTGPLLATLRPAAKTTAIIAMPHRIRAGWHGSLRVARRRGVRLTATGVPSDDRFHERRV